MKKNIQKDTNKKNTKTTISENTLTTALRSKNEKESEKDRIALEPIYIVDKGKPKTLNKKYFLKDDPKNIKNDFNIEKIEFDIMNMESIIEKEKKELFEQKDYLASLGFILTDKSSERMAKLIHYIKTKVFVLLEGPTGTSKTRTTLIAYKYIQHMEKLKKLKHKKHNEKGERRRSRRRRK